MKKRKGQSVIEFALVLPLFLLIMFGVVYTGMLFHDYAAISSLARMIAREAAVIQGDDYSEIANYYEPRLDGDLVTGFYKKADSNPLVIVPFRRNDDPDTEGVKCTIIMQLQASGFLAEMILPKTFGVEYFMKKEPHTNSST